MIGFQNGAAHDDDFHVFVFGYRGLVFHNESIMVPLWFAV
jgi:hypothetical protein